MQKGCQGLFLKFFLYAKKMRIARYGGAMREKNPSGAIFPKAGA